MSPVLPLNANIPAAERAQTHTHQPDLYRTTHLNYILDLSELQITQYQIYLLCLRTSKKEGGYVPSKIWQMSTIISLMSSSLNTLCSNDDDDDEL